MTKIKPKDAYKCHAYKKKTCIRTICPAQPRFHENIVFPKYF